MFRIRQTLKGSLWVLPLVGGVAGIGLSYVSVWIQGSSFVPNGWDYSAQTALTVLTTVVAATVGPDGIRRHGERARRADGDRDVLGAVHAALVPGQRPQGDARGADGDAGLLLFAPAPDRRGGSGSRRHAGRVLPGCRADPLPRLPRPLRPSDAAGQGRRARRAPPGGRRFGPRSSSQARGVAPGPTPSSR